MPTRPDQDTATGPTPTPRARLSRRAMIAGAGVAAAAAGAAAVVATNTEDEPVAAADALEFRGKHQRGITTTAQDRIHFASFDVTTEQRGELIALLKAWTDAADRMCAGLSAGKPGAMDGPLAAPPTDSGEAYGLAPAQLTITFGFGPGLFERNGTDRFGISAQQPAALRELPHFPGDNLDPAISGGDLCIQACSNDPQVAVHAVRNLARIGFGTVSMRWSQLGFGRSSATSATQSNARNMFGFIDGTANITESETGAQDDYVWVGEDGPTWLEGGTYLVYRRINMNIETWDRTGLGEQEQIIGRKKGTGAPLSGGGEHSAVDLDAVDRNGHPRIAVNAHIRLAAPSTNNGVRMLRRGYNFVDGADRYGRLDAGLMFIAFMQDPDTQYIPMQTRLARNDALSEYIQHRGSALFAVAPGAQRGGYIGDTLLY